MAQAINLSPLALQAMGDTKVMRAWAEVSRDLFDAKPAGVVCIENRKAAAALVDYGLVRPVTYLGQPVANRFRVPKSVAFISTEPDFD